MEAIECEMPSAREHEQEREHRVGCQGGDALRVAKAEQWLRLLLWGSSGLAGRRLGVPNGCTVVSFGKDEQEQVVGSGHGHRHRGAPGQRERGFCRRRERRRQRTANRDDALHRMCRSNYRLSMIRQHIKKKKMK